MKTRNRVLEIGLPVIMCLYVAFIIAFIIGGVYRSCQNRPVIGKEITAEDLIPWSAEEEDSLAEAPEEFLWDPLARKKSARIGGIELTVYLFYPQRGGDFYEYFVKRETVRRGAVLGTVSLPLKPPRWEFYSVEKNGETGQMTSEEFGEALRRLGLIIPPPDE